jgi:hypothetical protein
MLGEIAAGLSSLKTMKDLVQGLNAAKTEAAINGVKIELQGLILEAQQGLFAAQDARSADARRIAELEQQIVDLKDWEREKQRYEMKRFAPGSIAYCLKPDMAAGEPPHRICPNCYQQGKKGFLQATTDIKVGKRVHVCTSCHAEAALGQEMADSDEPRPPPDWSGPVSAAPRRVV